MSVKIDGTKTGKITQAQFVGQKHLLLTIEGELRSDGSNFIHECLFNLIDKFDSSEQSKIEEEP